MENKKAYVTFANAKRLTRSIITPSGFLSGEKLYEYIFETNLSGVLNEKEAMDLYKIKLLAEKSDLPSSFKVKDIGNYNGRTLIFSSNSKPKYHISKECPLLSSDYVNYKIPEVIRERGPEEIKKFIEFCTPHRRRIEEKDMSFIHLVNEVYNTKINSFEEFVLPNSGVYDIKSMNLTELQIFIILSLNKCLELLSENKDNKLLHNHHRFKSPKKEDLSKPIDECIKEYIENKINIIEGLRNFYYKSNDNSASATTYILELAGFAKCKSCS